MATIGQKLVPHLWFDQEARQAAEFYTSIFDDAWIEHTVTLEDTPSGAVEVVTFFLLGQPFQAISAGPLFSFNESISFMVKCDTQEEIDHYWHGLTAGGGQEVECGWLKDQFGLSWQVVPSVLDLMLQSSDPQAVARVTQVFLRMGKFDLVALERAYAGP